jgi:hypothetical protein
MLYCICNHKLGRHQKSERFISNKLFYCFDCDCMIFKQDNLKYLEECYKESEHA